MEVSALQWDKMVLDRTSERWRDLLALARLLLDKRFQTTTAGSGRGIALLFDMSTMFEEYVARLLARALAREGLQVRRQGGLRFCLKELADNQSGRFRMKHEILVTRGDQTLLVIDTKWKHLGRDVEDPKHGVLQADVYQAMAYGRVYNCPRLMLLYPHTIKLDGEDRTIARYQVTGSNDELAISTIDVGRAHEFERRLAKLVRDQLT